MSSNVVLITGGSTGIGLATAKLVAAKGYRLAICGHLTEDVDEAALACAAVSPQNHEPLKLVTDFSEPEVASEAVKKTIDHYGQLDILIVCAGALFQTVKGDPLNYDTYQRMMRINMDSAVKATLAAIPELKRSKGCIVYVSSLASQKPIRNLFAYCMTKASLSMFAKCMAVQLAPDVRVNIVNPGFVNTPLYKPLGGLPDKFKKSCLLGRYGEPEDIAACISFLISDKSSFIHGEQLVIDGGLSINPHKF